MTAEARRVALVTGSGGGLGLEIVSALAGDGWRVATTDVWGSGASFEADLRAPEACRRLITEVVDRHERLDLLVNNAATMYHGLLDQSDLDRWWDTIEVNLTAPFRLSRAAAPELRRREGQVINISSLMGYTGDAGFSAYCASKSGLVGLTKALARELAPSVRVNAIAPGHIDTPQQAVDAAAAGLTRQDLYQTYAAIIPIGRILDPAEVARLVVFLANETGFTGSCLHQNGGLLMV